MARITTFASLSDGLHSLALLDDEFDEAAGRVALKGPARVATTANITLSVLQTIDGVLVVAGNRVLVKDQADTTQNGVYDAASGTWARSSDFSSSSQILEGTQVFVNQGTVNTASLWAVTTDDPITIDISNIVFTRLFSAFATIANLSLLGNVSGSSAAPAEVLLSNAALLAGLNYWILNGSEISYQAGNVGIGNGVPSYKLDVAGGARVARSSDVDDGGDLHLGAGSGRWLLRTNWDDPGDFAIWDSTDVRRFRITGTGEAILPGVLRVARSSDVNDGGDIHIGAGTPRWLLRTNWDAAGDFAIWDSADVRRLYITGAGDATIAGALNAANTRVIANIKHYGAVSGGAAVGDIDTASTPMNLAAAAADHIYFPPGTWVASATDTWPAGKTYEFARGAILKPASGVDITIQGSVIIDHWEQAFDLSNGGSCSVVGIKHVRHEWWGATGDGTTNDQPACQAAHDCTEAATASEGGRHVIEIRSGKVYALSSTLQWRPTKTFVLHVEGGGGSDGGGGLEGAGGCVFKTKASFTGSNGLHVAGNADGLAGYRFGEIQVYNQTAGSGPIIGLKIGSDRNNRLESNRQNFIEAIRVSGFAVNALITNTRVLRVERFSVAPYDSVGTEVASGTGLLITVDGDGTTYANTSDLDFGDFQLEGAYGSSSPSGIGVQITSDIDNTAVAGIRFHRIVAYGCEQQVKIAASGGASIGDIWFQAGCQFEAPVRGSVATRAIVLIASGSGAIGGPSEVGDIHIDHTYMSGNGFQKTIEGTVASTGVIRTVYITNNNMPSSSLETIILNGSGGTVYDVHIHNNSLRGVATAAGTAISLANITNANCNDNTLADCSGLTNFILWSGASNHFVSHGNSAGGCATNSVANTATGSPTFSVANNI